MKLRGFSLYFSIVKALPAFILTAGCDFSSPRSFWKLSVWLLMVGKVIQQPWHMTNKLLFPVLLMVMQLYIYLFI